MAAPKRNRSKPDNAAQAQTRQSIQTTQLIKRLQAYALGLPYAKSNVAEVDSGRLRAIEILLKKVLPDLSVIDSTVEHSVASDLKQLMREIAQNPKRIDGNAS